ncbi:unnamed protein product [Paramecium pentaurelia]|uniref:Actin-fragmin kinase catalytic domain-containing protein n=1 Tax=Paramecium pentaurelia TaxID=43138 RepID=A0A8S1RVZ8_9CILI|nr:unnamed protein product [Paramecium pentaurelia]
MISQFTKPKRKMEHPDYAPYPLRRPGPGQDDRKSDIPLDYNLKEFNFASKTLTKKIVWSDLRAIALSDSLDKGAIFVETNEGSVVVKGYPNIAQGYFFSQLALVLGVPVPNKRIVRWDSSEFKIMTKELQRATFMIKQLHQKITNRLENPYLEVQEYLPGITLSYMGKARAGKIFNFYDPQSRHRLIKVGFIMGLDIFINNPSRFPLEIWQNSGNSEHMIARTEPRYTDTTKDLHDIDNLSFEYEYIYGLDSYSFERPPSYYTNVEEFLNKIFLEMKSIMQAQLDPLYETKDQKIECLNEFKQLVYDHTLYEIKEMSLLQVLLGIVLTIDNIVFMGPVRLRTLWESVTIENDWNNIWMKNLQGINMDFLESMVSIFQKFCTIYEDVVKYSKDITLNQYSFDEQKYLEIIMMNPKIKERIEKERENDLMNSQKLDKSEVIDEDEGEVLERNLNDIELDKKIEEMFMIDPKDIPKGENKNQKQQKPLTPEEQQQQQELEKKKYGGILAKKLYENE